MFANAIRNGAIDRAAIGLSGLCLVHCVGTAVLVMVLASAGGLLVDPRIHEAGLALAIVLGVIGLGRGALVHGFMLPVAIGSTAITVSPGRASRSITISP